jgi:hypothetical protein
LIGDDCLKKVDNLMLPGGHDVELAAHLDEAVVDMRTKVNEVLPKVNEVLPESTKTRSSGSAELADFAAKFTDISVGGSGENTSGRRVLLS